MKTGRKTKMFSDKVYKLLTRVPRGRVTTYKELAKAVGCRAYRAVGNALNKNRDPVGVPCYRVVRSDGTLGGYSKGLKKKVGLLKKDGIVIREGKINLKKYGFEF
jgi:methylated-DNA-[protein]-cysteine S-methyltransferase